MGPVPPHPAAEEAPLVPEFRRSKRAKYYRIIVRPTRVEVVIPRRGRRSVAEAFARDKRQWIAQKLAQVRARERQRGGSPRLPERYVDGAMIPFRGRELRLRHVPRKGRSGAGSSLARLMDDDVLRVIVPDAGGEERQVNAAKRHALAWIDAQALVDAQGWAERYAPQLGRRPTRFLMRQQKTRWGSCSADGTIRLNRLLIAAPREAFEYVVVHELCHLEVRNHSPDFWRLVEALLPDYRRPKAWLREQGGRLD